MSFLLGVKMTNEETAKANVRFPAHVEGFLTAKTGALLPILRCVRLWRATAGSLISG